MSLDDVNRERDRILLSMDVEAAKAFIVEHGGKIPKGKLNWEKILHLARFEVTSLPREAVIDSQIWLARTDPRRLSDYSQNSPYCRVTLDLIFPRDEFVKVMEKLEGRTPVWP